MKIAGVIWIGAGALSLINMVITFAQQGGGNAAPGTNPASGVCAGLIGLAFLVCGYQTVTGQASDTRGNGIGSILLGLLQFLIGGAILALGGAGVAANANAGNPNNAAPAGVVVVIGLMIVAVGLVMITAGVLALIGRTAYLEWKRENAPRPSRRKRSSRRRDDEDDEED